MTACTRIRELMLEAEPEALRGKGTSEVADHVRACRSCARAAGRILEETEALGAWLEGASAPPPPVGRILRHAGVARDRRRRWLWAPAAAAAAVAAVFVALESHGPEPRAGAAVVPAAPAPVVEPRSDATVAVMQTDDPDITVLWFF